MAPPAVLLGPVKILTAHMEMIEGKSRDALTEQIPHVWGLRFYRMGFFTV